VQDAYNSYICKHVSVVTNAMMYSQVQGLAQTALLGVVLLPHNWGELQQWDAVAVTQRIVDA